MIACHPYAGWEHGLRRAARHGGVVPSSVVVYGCWITHRGWRGQCEHLYPNWWSSVAAPFVKVRIRSSYFAPTSWHFQAPLTQWRIVLYLLGPPRGEEAFHRACCSGPVGCGHGQRVKVSQRVWLQRRTWRHWVMVRSQFFFSFCNLALEKWVLLEGFWYTVSQDWEAQYRGGLAGTIRKQTQVRQKYWPSHPHKTF